MQGVSWNYYKKYQAIDDKYLPVSGEGDTMATQIITATAKLVYKWYNDGDIFDNTHYMQGFGNDLSTYANWLYKFAPGTAPIFDRIESCYSEAEYENILKDLVDLTNNEDYLKDYTGRVKIDSIYTCSGPFKIIDTYDEEDW